MSDVAAARQRKQQDPEFSTSAGSCGSPQCSGLLSPSTIMCTEPRPPTLLPTGIGAHTVIMTATFTHGFWPDTISSLVHGGWSIAVEMTFYLFFPFIITVVGKRASSYLVLARIVFVLYRLSVPALREIFSFLYISDSTSIIDEFLYLNFSINFQRFCSGFGSSLCQKIWLPGTSWGQSLSLRFIFSCRGLT